MTEQHEVGWKEFEKLVGRIQAALAGRSAVVKWNDFVPDEAGEPRQVDVTIRKIVNGKPSLITVEARKHQHSQDVTWIEELIGKRVRLGVDVTIAVSGSGFSKPALVAAERNGIVARTLIELEQEGLTWLA